LDRTFSRNDLAFDPEGNLYVCPAGKELKKYHRSFPKPRDGLTKEGTMIYSARKQDFPPSSPSSPCDGTCKKTGPGRAVIDNWKKFAIFHRLEKIVETAGPKAPRANGRKS
jgi:hypothetical protein